MTRDERATEAPPLAAVTASVLRLPAGISEPDRIAVGDGNANVYTESWRLET